MKTENPRQLALALLNRFDRDKTLPAPEIRLAFARRSDLDLRDKAFTLQLVQGVFRWRGRLDWTIRSASHVPVRKIDPLVMNILRLALYQVLFLDRVPDSAAVNEAVKQCKAWRRGHVASFVNGLLRSACREKDRTLFPDRVAHPIRFLSVYYSFPEWLVEKWVEEWGFEVAEKLLNAGNEIPTLSIRTNTTKITRTGLLRCLELEGLKGRPAGRSPEGILIEDMKGPVNEYQAFKKGFFQVQDEAAQIASHLLAPQPGDRILDLCAGLGGKTTHLSALMDGRGLVLALDIDRRRLLHLEKNGMRLGAKGLVPLSADASQSLSNLFSKKFDRILLDAPCSGLGVLSRRPDGKWNKTEEDVRRLARLQRAMALQAASILKTGGSLLYVTCTISSEENEGVVRECLNQDSRLVLVDLAARAPEWALELIDSEGFFRTLPHAHGMNGFFAALFSRK